MKTRDPWFYGTWEGARIAMHEQNLTLSLVEKIQILEDMEEVTVNMHRQGYLEGRPMDDKIRNLVEAAFAREKTAVAAKSIS